VNARERLVDYPHLRCGPSGANLFDETFSVLNKKSLELIHDVKEL